MMSDSDNQSSLNGQIDSLCFTARKINATAPEDKHQAILDLIVDVQAFWNASECCRSLKARLAEHTPAPDWKFERCILLGLGHIAGSSSNEAEPLRPVLQFVVFLSFVKLGRMLSTWIIPFADLPVVGDPKSELFAQDPRFTIRDKAILAAYGVHVINVPEAENMIDERTFVMSPSLIIPGLFLIPAINQPGLVVGSGEESTRRHPEEHLQKVLK